MTATLRRNIIGFVISALLFSVAIVLICNLYAETNPVPTKDAEVVISDVTVDESYNSLLQWECSNTRVTSYQVYSRDNDGDEKYTASTISTRRYYRAKTGNGGFFTYCVRAYNSESEENESSEFSPYVSILIDPGKEICSISGFVPTLTYSNDNGKVRLIWDRPVNCAVSSYCIYRKNDKGDWEIAKVTAPYATAYTDERSSGEYKLVARIRRNGELQVSQPSEIIFAEVNDE